MSATAPVLGTMALTAVSVLRVMTQIVAFPVIGHILGPQAYGQIALVTPFVILAMIIAEFGLGACIIRAEKSTPELESAVFTFSFVLSLAIVALFAALASPLGALLHEPAFPPLLLGMSSLLPLAALNVVPAARLLRAQRYGVIAVSDAASLLGGLVGLLLGVACGWGAWSSGGAASPVLERQAGRGRGGGALCAMLRRRMAAGPGAVELRRQYCGGGVAFLRGA